MYYSLYVCVTCRIMICFFTGCLGYTVYCEIGGEACLDFLKNSPPITYAIKKGNLSVCVSSDGTSTYIFDAFKVKVNCNISSTKMSMCLRNFQSGDGGIFSLHDGLTNTSVLINSIALVKASK